MNINEIYDDMFGYGHDLSEEKDHTINEQDDGVPVDTTVAGGDGSGDGDDDGLGDGDGSCDGLDDDDADDICPMPGMKYDSRESLRLAYREYAKVKGFSVSIRSSSPKYFVVACSKGRKPKNVKKFTHQTECPAKVNTTLLADGKVIVTCVDLNHNHTLEPELSMFMPGNRGLTTNMKRLLENRDISGYRTVQNVRPLEVMAGGYPNLGVTERDCRNYIDKMRRLRLGEGDANAIHKLFLRMQLQDNNFFHIMDVDDDGRLRNVMWVHPRSRAAYQDFHDVISFDTTYLVNKYKMPLATVVGVNHHNQSILLGCGLLSHEQSGSFKWFFNNWLQAMGGVQPTAILTDQCESIGIAVKEVLPSTIHRLCLWQISYKIATKFKCTANFQGCKSDFYSTIYDSLSITEFESRWTNFLSKHGLHNNNWLNGLFEERMRWAPVYLNHMFWAGMVSTQRSESMHAFFDGYANSKSTLKLFVEQYEIVIHNKLQKEMQADYKSKCVSLKHVSCFF